MNKASFETKTSQDEKNCNKYKKIMYPAVTKPKIPRHKKPWQKSKKINKTSNFWKINKSTSPSKHFICSSNNIMSLLCQYKIGRNLLSTKKMIKTAEKK